MDRVALLLETRKHGCGDWRRIGSKYNMKDPGIAALANAPLNAGDRGKAVLDFVKATMPTLTVYEFCKTLKEDNFKRLDIVEELENHFLVSIKSDGQWIRMYPRFSFDGFIHYCQEINSHKTALFILNNSWCKILDEFHWKTWNFSHCLLRTLGTRLRCLWADGIHNII